MQHDDRYTRRDALRLGAGGITGLAGLASTSTASAQTGGTWSTRRALPVSRSNLGSGVVNTVLFVFGGIRDGQGLLASARTYSFSQTTGRWTRRSDMPQALWGPCGVAAAGKLFSFGGAPTDAPYNGTPPTDRVFRYTPGVGWTNLTSTDGVRCPYPNWAMGGVYNPDDGLIYCFGGGTDATTRESATDHGVRSSSAGRFDESRVWTFDPVAEEVVDADFARLSVAKRWPTAALATVGGEPYVYAIAGYRGILGATATNDRIDPETGEVTEVRPVPRLGHYGTRSNPVIGNRVYLTHGLFSGGTVGSQYLLVCHRYNPETDSYGTNLASPRYRRVGSGSGVVNGRLYVVGGHVKQASGYHDCVPYNERFTP